MHTKVFLLLLFCICIECYALTPYQQAAKHNANAEQHMLSTQYVPASKELIAAIAIAEKHQYNELLYESFVIMGKIFFHQNNYEKAKLYYKKAFNIDINNPLYAANYYKYIGDIGIVTGKMDSARAAYAKAEKLYRKISVVDSNLLAKFYSNYSITFESDYTRKLQYALTADKYYTKVSSSQVINTGNIGTAYKDIVVQRLYDSLSMHTPLIPSSRASNIALAQQYLNAAIQLAIRTKNKVDQAYYSGVLSELQYEEGDYKNAYLNFRHYAETTDSAFSQESKNALASVESQLEIQKKNAVITQQKRARIVLIVGISLLSIIGLLLYIQTINRKRTNQKLQSLNAELDAANQIKTKFFSIISHDLRSPIANIVTLLNFQKENKDSLSEAVLEKHRNKVIQDAENLLESMETMLLWSKGQMHNFKANIQKVKVQDLYNYLNRFFSNYDFLDIHFLSDNIDIIYTDENFMQVIMQNLTANAIRATKETKEPKIVWRAYQKDTFIVLEIEDNGPGISADQLESIIHPSTTKSDKHGLGLQIVNDLAKIIHCSLEFSTKDGKGFMAKIYLNNQ
jgi:signal transduction histidine kinase